MSVERTATGYRVRWRDGNHEARFEITRRAGGWRWRLVDGPTVLCYGEPHRWVWQARLDARRFQRRVRRARVCGDE